MIKRKTVIVNKTDLVFGRLYRLPSGKLYKAISHNTLQEYTELDRFVAWLSRKISGVSGVLGIIGLGALFVILVLAFIPIAAIFAVLYVIYVFILGVALLPLAITKRIIGGRI